MDSRIYKIPYYISGLFGLCSEDLLLASYPKSGNTWIRFFLCNLISLQEWNGREVSFPLLDSTMPEFGNSNLLRHWPHNTIPRVVKTHKKWWPIFQGIDAILLVRDPRDVMVSYYFYKCGKVKSEFNGSFSEFIRDPNLGVPAWVRHYRSWKTRANIFLRFEDLKSDDISTFQKLSSAINVGASKSTIKEAVRRSRFEKMKEVEEKYGVRTDVEHFHEESQFMRKGKSGDWKEMFNNSDISYLNNVLERNNVDIYK
jgi:hypothetical protein